MKPTNPSEKHTSTTDERPEEVLLPLDLCVALARFPGEDPVLHQSDGGEELEWGGEEDGDRVEALFPTNKAG
jgi:hypothetical protein